METLEVEFNEGQGVDKYKTKQTFQYSCLLESEEQNSRIKSGESQLKWLWRGEDSSDLPF